MQKNQAQKNKGRVLVTGADGFIGSHLVEGLVRQGAQVRALAFYNSFNSWGWLDTVDPEIMSQVEVVTGDIRDPFGVDQMVEGCTSVCNLAALIGIPYSYRAPAHYVDTNIMGTVNLLQAARRYKVERFIQTSTSEVYGSAQTVPITEDHPLVGQSPYAATKIGADQLALSFYRSFDVPAIVLRPFNTYGPRQSARAVIPTIISQLASGKRQIKLGSTDTTRDFNYVKDTVQGFIAALGCDSAAFGEVINIGSGFEISIQDAALLIAEVMGTDIELVSDAERVRPEKSEVQRLLAANTKAKDLLDWEPENPGIKGLQTGLRETCAWFQNPANMAHYKSEIYNV